MILHAQCALKLLFLIIMAWTVPLSSSANSLSSKRIISEWKDINNSGLDLSIPFNNSAEDCGIRLSPLKKNLLEWHFSFKGMEGSNFDGGIYHGKILLHPEYPRKAPVICINTPCGRWETNVPICLSASSHHQELWNPNWNLRTLVLSLRAFMTTQPGEIGSIVSTPETHKRFAKLSTDYYCKECGAHHQFLVNGMSLIGNNPQSSKLFLAKADEHLLRQNAKLRPQKSVKALSNSAMDNQTAQKKYFNNNEVLARNRLSLQSILKTSISKVVIMFASFFLVLFIKGRYWNPTEKFLI